MCTVSLPHFDNVSRDPDRGVMKITIGKGIIKVALRSQYDR